MTRKPENCIFEKEIEWWFWRGPYKITKKVGKVNYKIELTDGQIRRKIFHINMLKPWKEAAESFLNVIEDEQEEILYPTQEQQELHEVQYGTHLMMEQRNQLQKMLKEFPEIITKEPGKTMKVKHRILTNNQQPIRQWPYRIPPALREEVTKELKELLDTGIVEESSSEWSSPMVIVKKKDRSNCICVDYRKLNAATKFDAYPMP